MDAPFTVDGAVAAAPIVAPAFLDAAARVRMLVRGGFADATAIDRLIDQLASDHARSIGGARDARVRSAKTLDARERDVAIADRDAERQRDRIALAEGRAETSTSSSERARDHLRDVLHEVARIERRAVREAVPPFPDTNAAIDRAFAALDAAGLVALQAAGFTQSDGWDDCWALAAKRTPKPRGACFYHEQDLARAVAGEALCLAFGAFGDPQASVAIGHEIVAALRAEGVTVEWDGTQRSRISIAPFAWYRVPQ